MSGPAKQRQWITRSLAGPAIWTAHFFVLYGGHTLLCAIAPAASRGTAWMLLAGSASIVGIVLIGLLVLQELRPMQRPERETSGYAFGRAVVLRLGSLSAAGLVWTMMAAAALAPCAP
jgi:phage protein U